MNIKSPFRTEFALRIANLFGQGNPEKDWSMSEEVSAREGAGPRFLE